MDLEDPFVLDGPKMQEVLIRFVFRGPSIQVHLLTLLCIINSFIWQCNMTICISDMDETVKDLSVSLSLFLVGQKDTWNLELLMVWTFNHCASVKPVQNIPLPARLGRFFVCQLMPDISRHHGRNWSEIAERKSRFASTSHAACHRTEPQLVVLPEAVARW